MATAEELWLREGDIVRDGYEPWNGDMDRGILIPLASGEGSLVKVLEADSEIIRCECNTDELREMECGKLSSCDGAYTSCYPKDYNCFGPVLNRESSETA